MCFPNQPLPLMDVSLLNPSKVSLVSFIGVVFGFDFVAEGFSYYFSLLMRFEEEETIFDDDLMIFFCSKIWSTEFQCQRSIKYR